MKYNFNLRPLTKEQTKKEAQSIHFVSYFLKGANNYKFVFSTGFKVLRQHWNDKTQRVKNVREATHSQLVNNFLNELSAAVDKFSIEQRVKREPITPQSLKDFLDEYTNRNKEKIKVEILEFIPFIKKFINESPLRVNLSSKKNIAECTIQKYRTTLSHIESYAQYQGLKTLKFDDIDINFYSGFVSYLTNVKNMKPNTVGKYISAVKTFLSEAENEKDVPKIPQAYKGRNFKTLKVDTENIYLNKSELKTLETLDLSDNSRLDKVRDLFLIGAWTGLRFSDFTEITRERVVLNEKQNYDIRLRQQKTGGLVVVPCNKVVLSILNKYDFVLPRTISNQKFNDYVKELCQLAGFDSRHEVTTIKGGKKQTDIYEKWERVSTHTARRSFATNLYSDGVQSKTIMSITGHKSESSFYKYIVLGKEEHAEIVRKHYEQNE